MRPRSTHWRNSASGKLSEGIRRLEAQAAASRAEAEAKAFDPLEYQKKVRNVLALIQDPDQSEAAKNTALRSILSYIVYEKADRRLALYFYP